MYKNHEKKLNKVKELSKKVKKKSIKINNAEGKIIYEKQLRKKTNEFWKIMFENKSIVENHTKVH